MIKAVFPEFDENTFFNYGCNGQMNAPEVANPLAHSGFGAPVDELDKIFKVRSAGRAGKSISRGYENTLVLATKRPRECIWLDYFWKFKRALKILKEYRACGKCLREEVGEDCLPDNTRYK